MLKTKYGNTLSNESIQEYLDRLIGKIFKLLPLWEKDYDNFIKNHKRLMDELCSAEKMVLYCGFYIELINKLEHLLDESQHGFFKTHMRECIDIVGKLKKKVGEWEIGKSIK